MPSASDSTSLYRRHRPGSFDEVVGQQHVVRTLRNAVEQGKVHHAYLFVGSRGTGKTSMAKILARSLNCERGGPTVTPCGECESCLTIAAGTSIDVIEMDAASNRSVDDVRDLRERVAYAPAGGRWKVYILDEAHMLTKEAWNAFLKTLEEPPPNTVFVLATTEAHKVMATIADRCQRFDFQRPSLEQISEVLARVAAAEGIEAEDGGRGDDRPLGLGQLPRRARHPRPARRLRRRARSRSTRFSSCSAPPTPSCSSTPSTRSSPRTRKARPARGREDGPLGPRPGPVRPRPARPPAPPARHPDGRRGPRTPSSSPPPTPSRLAAQAAAIGAATLVRTIDELAAALTAVREGDDARMAVEIALLKAARPDLDPSAEGLLRRVERLESTKAGSPAGPVAAGTSTGGERSRPRVLSQGRGALRQSTGCPRPPSPDATRGRHRVVKSRARGAWRSRNGSGNRQTAEDESSRGSRRRAAQPEDA